MGKSEKHAAHLFRRLTWPELDSAYLQNLIQLAQAEDLDGAGLATAPDFKGDATTASLPSHLTGAAALVARSAMIVCGVQLVPAILEQYGADVPFASTVNDGDSVQPGTTIGTLSGNIQTLLSAERIVLNFLQRLSGIATLTQQYCLALEGSRTKLLDTRKTTPGFRMLEKYAVACGGGWNHRLGLFDRVMLKDNHLASTESASGESLAQAVRQVRTTNPALAIEVEVDSIEQIPPVLEAGTDVIMLDNFSIPELKAAIQLIGDQAYTEASGGITLDTLPAIGKLGLDFVSCGALIHQSQWVDIGLDWNTP